MSSATNAELRFVNLEQVANHFDVSPDTIRKWMQQGKFPRPTHRGAAGNRKYWDASILDKIDLMHPIGECRTLPAVGERRA